MDDFDQEPGQDEYDDPTAAVAVVSLPAPAPAASPAPAPAASAPSTAVSPAVAAAIPGVELRRGAEQGIADIDTMALAELLEPSRLTEYLSRTIGEYQAVIDVDAAPGQALKAMMRQALLLVLANQKIAGKSVGVADQLQALQPRLEEYLFGAGDKSAVGRLERVIGTIEPAGRKVLENILVEADSLIIKLVKAHVDAAVDGHELVERRREVERLTSERDVARAAEQGAKDRLEEFKTLVAGWLADAKQAGARLAWMALGLGTVVGIVLGFAGTHFVR